MDRLREVLNFGSCAVIIISFLSTYSASTFDIDPISNDEYERNIVFKFFRKYIYIALFYSIFVY